MHLPTEKYVVTFTRKFTPGSTLAGLAFTDSLTYPNTIEGYTTAQAYHSRLIDASEQDTVIKASCGSDYVIVPESITLELEESLGHLQLDQSDL
jgi:hypothetical protein